MSEIQVARKNYNGIDVAKFICSILVIAIHVDPFATSDNSTLQQLHFFLSQYIARIAVPFFFIAAGYFLFRKTSPDSFDLRPVRKYIGRIVRLYVLWSILYFPLVLYYAIRGNIGFRQFVTTYARRLIFVGSYTHLCKSALPAKACQTVKDHFSELSGNTAFYNKSVSVSVIYPAESALGGSQQSQRYL